MTHHNRERARCGRRGVRGGVSWLVPAAAALALLLAPAAHAQNAPNTGQSAPPNPNNAAPPPATLGRPENGGENRTVNQPLPTSVLLFPALVTGNDGAVANPSPAVRQTQEIVTSALQKYLERGGVGVVVYSPRLPSIERAASEGTGLKPEEATRGPGDDPRAGQRFAEIIGANEYLSVTIDDYKYTSATRRVTFTLSITRSEANGTPISTTSIPAVGEAPADVAGSRQEGSAVARAAETVAEQTVRSVYPQTAVQLDPPKPKKPRRRNKLGWIIPAVAAGVALIVPR